MRAPNFAVWGALALVMAIGRGVTAPSDASLRAVGEAREASFFSFEVNPADFSAVGPASSAQIKIQHFDALERRDGGPDLPRRVVRVAIPKGVVPRLEVRLEDELLIPGIRPRPVIRSEVESFGETAAAGLAEPGFESPDDVAAKLARRETRDEDPALYAGPDPYPRQVAWLGDVGVLRDQRYVEVHLVPIRWDPALGGLRIARSFRVTVHFDGDSGERFAPKPERAFESVYRNALLNYGQGMTFRLSAAREPALLERSGTPGNATAPNVGPRYRIKIRRNGVVRLDYASVSTTPFAAENLSAWKLTSRGVEVPIDIRDDGDGVLEPGEWVQFYGQALDEEPKAVLNADFPGTDPDLYEARDFSDENVYFLTAEPGARSRVQAVASAPTNIRTPPLDFESVTHLEADEAFRPLGDADPWYWLPALCVTNCAGSPAPPSSRTLDVSLPGLRDGTLPMRVIVRVRGVSEDSTVFPDHRSTVRLLDTSNRPLAVNTDDGSFDGRTVYTHDFTWIYPGSGDQATELSRVEWELTPTAPAVNSVAYLDWVEVRYRRAFAAESDVLTFDWPDGDSEFLVSGLQTPFPSIYEVTARAGESGISSPVRLTGATTSGTASFSVRFRVDDDSAIPDGTMRRFVVAGDGGASIPAAADFAPDVVSDLRSTSIQADLVVIAHESLQSSSGLAAFLAHRASQGVTSKVALIGDVEDEFNDGLPGPLAIKRFLQWVMSTAPGEGWAEPKPSFVLLLGDASYDYKGGTASGNFVPTQILFKNLLELGYYASDNLLAAVQGSDQLPDLMIGRIPARNVGEANVVFQKIVQYEQSTPAGNWRRHAVLISDRGKGFSVAEAAAFRYVNDLSASFMKRPPHTVRFLDYWLDPPFANQDPSRCPIPAADAIRAEIKRAVNGTDGVQDGAAIVQYVGHGNFVLWSDDRIFNQSGAFPDVDGLLNGTKLPWMVAHNCLTGGFHTTATYSIGEDWLKKSGGGAIAVLAPSGLSNTWVGEQAVRELFGDLYGPAKERTAGIPVMKVLAHFCGQGSVEPCQSYVYLGDPSMTLAIPAVGAPGALDATAGDRRVDLFWDSSATPGVAYDVYRATALVPPSYTKLTGTPLTGTTFADMTAVNATRYYYYVVALDADGFESRWSNFNSDCAVSGPDCVDAIPMNPNAPAPPFGVSVVDTEIGGSLRVAWAASPESDLKNYTVSWGTSSGAYTQTANAGKSTLFQIGGLTDGVRYYVAVTATNTSSRTSGFSAEASGVPTQVRGARSPAFITTLRVAKSGTDAVLTWDPVTSDIYGKPETVAFYEVFRGDAPGFVPSPSNRIGTPATPTFSDTGALSSPAAYHYLVRAVDSDGNVGGLGNQLPGGIAALHVFRGSPSTTVVLSWPAVNSDFDGSGTTIAGYNVYVSEQPITRSAIGRGTVPVFQYVTGTSLDLPLPPPANQYYSVLAVDARGNLSSF